MSGMSLGELQSISVIICLSQNSNSCLYVKIHFIISILLLLKYMRSKSCSYEKAAYYYLGKHAEKKTTTTSKFLIKFQDIHGIQFSDTQNSVSQPGSEENFDFLNFII